MAIDSDFSDVVVVIFHRYVELPEGNGIELGIRGLFMGLDGDLIGSKGMCVRLNGSELDFENANPVGRTPRGGDLSALLPSGDDHDRASPL